MKITNPFISEIVDNKLVVSFVYGFPIYVTNQQIDSYKIKKIFVLRATIC